MATELAQAYVKIIPSMGGVGEAIKSEFGAAGDEAGESAGKSSGGKFGSAFKTAGAAALKIGGAAIAAGAAAIGKTVQSAVAGYADYQQLVGGIESIFDNSADIVQQYAANAYQTAGLSANEYMQTVTSFSASLLSSLNNDTGAAAEYANMAITDMSDNANRYGTDIESIQNAYIGFSKQNFTMLDNLSLGFAGTKEGMQALLDKATEINGIEYDISSYSDIVEAIHVVQEEMGVAGTTAAEASGTISGSLSMLKASWSNLVVGFANPDADLGLLISNMVDSAKLALQNLLPAVTQALTSIGTAIAEIAPIISEMLPGLVETVLPSLLQAATSLLDGLLAALPSLLSVLVDQAPTIIITIVNAIIALLPQIVALGLDLILALADGLIAALPDLIPALVQVILQIEQKLTDPSTLMQLIHAAFMLIGALAQGLINAIPVMIANVPTIIGNLVMALIESGPQLLASGLQLIIQLAMGILQGAANCVSAVVNLFANIKSAFQERISQALQWGRDLISNFVSGITSSAANLWGAVKNAASGIASLLHFSEPDEGPLSNFHTWAPDMMHLWASGIRDNIGLVTGAVDEAAAAAMGGFTGLNGDISLSSSGAYRPASALGATVTVPAINIYTQEGQDTYAIAQEVGYVLGLEVRQKGAVYA